MAVDVPAGEPHRIAVDFAEAQGELRALHGINKGPLAANGLVDVTDAQKRLRIPSTRLHDCHNPNPAGVDIHHAKGRRDLIIRRGGAEFA